MRAALAVALVTLLLVSGLAAVVPAAVAQEEAASQAAISMALSAVRIAEAYGANMSAARAYLALAVEAESEGNYSGAYELAMRAASLAAEYMEFMPAPPASAAGSELSALWALELAVNASPLQQGLRQQALGSLALARAYVLQGQGARAAVVEGAIESALLNSSLNASVAGLRYELSQVSSLAKMTASLAAASVTSKLSSAGLAQQAQAIYSAVERLVLSSANYTAQLGPSGLVGQYGGLESLRAYAGQLSPAANMSYRLNMSALLLNLSSRLSNYSQQASVLASELKLEHGGVLYLLSNASLMALDLSRSLALYSQLNLTGASGYLTAAEGYLGYLRSNGTLTAAAEALLSNMSNLLGESANLSSAAEVIRSYVEANGSLSYGVEAQGLLSSALAAAASARPAYSQLDEAVELCSQALAEASNASANPYASPYVGGLVAWLSAGASAAAKANASLLNLTYSTYIASPPGATSYQLEALTYDDWGMGNLSLAISSYMNGSDDEAFELLSQSSVNAQSAEALLGTYGPMLSPPAYGMLYGLSSAIYSLDTELQTIIKEYPSPPQKYLGYIENVSEAIYYLWLSVNSTREGYSWWLNGSLARANASYSAAESYFWDSVPYVDSLKPLSSRVPSLAQQALAAVSDVASLAYSLQASSLLSESLALESGGLGGNLSALNEASLMSAQSLAAAEGVGRAADAVGASPSAPAGFNITMAWAANASYSLASAIAGLVSLRPSAVGGVSELGQEAEQTSWAILALSRASSLLSQGLQDAYGGLYAAGENATEASIAVARGLADATNVTYRAPEYVASLGRPLLNASLSALRLEEALRGLYNEGGSEAAELQALSAASEYLAELSGLLRGVAPALVMGNASAYLAATASQAVQALRSLEASCSMELPQAQGSPAADLCNQSYLAASRAVNETEVILSALARAPNGTIVAVGPALSASEGLYVVLSGNSYVLAVGPLGLAVGEEVALGAWRGWYSIISYSPT